MGNYRGISVSCFDPVNGDVKTNIWRAWLVMFLCHTKESVYIIFGHTQGRCGNLTVLRMCTEASMTAQVFAPLKAYLRTEGTSCVIMSSRFTIVLAKLAVSFLSQPFSMQDRSMTSVQRMACWSPRWCCVWNLRGRPRTCWVNFALSFAHSGGNVSFQTMLLTYATTTWWYRDPSVRRSVAAVASLWSYACFNCGLIIFHYSVTGFDALMAPNRFHWNLSTVL